MGDTVKRNTKVAVEIESTQGTYVAPTGASSFLQTLEDGLELNISQETIERSVFSGSIGQITPRVGIRSSSGTIPVEMRADATAGAAPEFDKLMRSALGTRRQLAGTVTTKSSGNTDDVLQIQNADIASFAVNDIVLVKESGAYHVSPISAVDNTNDAANITLKIPHPDGSFSNSVVIEKFTLYTVAESGHPSLSITKYVEDAVEECSVGARVTGLSLENFSTGQIPSLNFSFEGLNFTRELDAPDFSPSYDAALPPIMLDGRVYQDDTEITINEMTLSLENTLGYKTGIENPNGRVSSRITERVITGSMVPYKADNSIANFTKFVNNTSFSLFAYGKNATSTPGEFQNVIAIYMPNCTITELGEQDQDGLLQENVAFSANRGPSGTVNELYIAFI